MSFLMNENNGGVAGRRRVSQVSNDEWRAALQQQIEEKKLREQQQKRYRGYEDDTRQQQQQQQPQRCGGTTQQYGDHDPGCDHSGNNDNNAWDSDDHHQYQQQPDPNLMMRPGRRNVQQMSNDAWREALEQQIREKKEREQLQESGGDQEGSFPDSQQQQQHGQARAMTTPLPGNNAIDHPQAQHGRRRVGIQTEEDYLKSLQDQLEVQKRFEQEALEFKKAQRQLRRKILIDDEPESKEVAQPPASIPATSVPKIVDPTVVHLRVSGSDSRKQSKPVDVGVPESKHSSDESLTHPAISSNQAEAEEDSSSQPKTNTVERIAPAVATAADPVVLAKIVDFCEELKRQNEEVKQQLVEQHSVLASLRSTLAVAKPQAPGDKMSVAAVKSLSSMKKPPQTVNAIPRRRTGSGAVSAEEKKGKKETLTETHESKRAESTAKTNARVARPPVVRARPIRGKSKIPFPSGVASAILTPCVLEAKSTHAVAELKVVSEESREETSDDALKQAILSEEDITSDAKDTRSVEPVTGCKPKAITKYDEREDTDDAEATKWDAKSELRDDEDERSPAKSHQLFDNEESENDDEDHAEAKSYVNVREHKLDQEEEDFDDGDSDELTIIHSDSYLILDNEVGLCDNVDEVPLGDESKLLRCEASPARDGDSGEIKSCSSFVLVDSASSLVSLDRSLGDVFSPWS